MERRGSGFKKIIEDYQFQQNYNVSFAPVFQSEYGSFFLTLKNLNYYLGGEMGTFNGYLEVAIEGIHQDTHSNGKETLDWDSRMNQVIELIRENDQIGREEIMKKLGFTERQLSATIKLLKDAGRLRREGFSRNGRWVVEEMI